VLLVAVVVPAEYGIDPTGIRKMLGLKTMGEIKMDMDKGSTVQYRWATRGGPVTFDTHGEGSEVKYSVSYKKGKDA